jgi:hypothetical protein
LKNIVPFSIWISEKLEYHDKLNPKIWKEEKIFPEIRKKLLAIANDFWNSLKLEIKIIDIQLTGSIANYNWTSQSDLDVHIIVDFKEIDSNTALVRKALDGQRFIWNQRHQVELRGHEVECYIQDVNEQHISTGLFSLLENRWKSEPSWNPPKVSDKEINEKIRVIKQELSKIKKEIKKADSKRAKELFDYLDRMKSKILKNRKAGLEKDGENSIENLVFKELRRDGTIESVISTMTFTYSKIYEE